MYFHRYIESVVVRIAKCKPVIVVSGVPLCYQHFYKHCLPCAFYKFLSPVYHEQHKDNFIKLLFGKLFNQRLHDTGIDMFVFRCTDKIPPAGITLNPFRKRMICLYLPFPFDLLIFFFIRELAV